MGMFDSLYVSCPCCGNSVEFQSKAGDCNLNEYTVNNVDPRVALDLQNDEEKCESCLNWIKLNVQSIVVVAPYIKPE